MSNMTDVMIDIESFGNGKNACIVQIGACYFDRVTGEIGNTFDYNIDANNNGDMDASAIYFWLQQSPEAQASILKEPRLPLEQVLVLLNVFLQDAKQIWSHATFDFVIIMNAYRSLGIKPTFSYKSARDIRTLLDLARVSTKSVGREGIHHNGLDDAKFQVKYCVEAFKKLQSKEKDHG